MDRSLPVVRMANRFRTMSCDHEFKATHDIHKGLHDGARTNVEMLCGWVHLSDTEKSQIEMQAVTKEEEGGYLR